MDELVIHTFLLYFNDLHLKGIILADVDDIVSVSQIEALYSVKMFCLDIAWQELVCQNCATNFKPPGDAITKRRLI